MANISSNNSEDSNVLKLKTNEEDKLPVKIEQHELSEQALALKNKLECDDTEKKKNNEETFDTTSNIKFESIRELNEDVSKTIIELNEKVSQKLCMLDDHDKISTEKSNLEEKHLSAVKMKDNCEKDNNNSQQDELTSNKNKVGKGKSFKSRKQKLMPKNEDQKDIKEKPLTSKKHKLFFDEDDEEKPPMSKNRKTYSKLDAEKSPMSKNRKTYSQLDAEKSPKRARKGKNMTIEDDKVKPNVGQKNDKKYFSLTLGHNFEIRNNLQKAKKNVVKHLYKIIYNNSPPIDGSKALNAILDFACFSFKESSSEYSNRLRMLKRMVPTLVENIAKIFDIKCSQTRMASEIMKFLMKIQKHLIKYIEQENSFQPIVNLERLSLDDEAFSKAMDVNKQSSIKSSLRTSFRKKEIPDFIVKDKVVKTRSTCQINNSKTSHNKQETKVLHGKIFISTPKKNDKMPKKKEKPLTPKKLDGIFEKIEEDKAPQIKKEILSESEDMDIENKKIADSYNNDKISSKDALLNPQVVLESIDNLSLINENIKDDASENLKTKSIDSIKICKDSSSEGTISAEESHIELNKDMKKLPKKGKSIKLGMPLKKFPKIVDSINTANFNDLQRLHILLFGASEDKLETLRSNILAFGGFPFVEESKEWKEKEFLLSLLAQNTLKDYLNLLCIEYKDEPQASLVIRLMKFLSCPTPKELEPSKFSDKPESPKSNLPEENTMDISIQTSKPSQPDTNSLKPSTSASPIKIVSKKSTNKEKELKKKPKLKAKQKTITKKRGKKILMDDAQVRRMEADIAREQRIIAREKRMMEQETQKLLEQTAKRPFKPPTIKMSKPLDKKKLPPLPPATETTDLEKLDALLQTVYKRRALKAAGATISTPNKGTKIRLGELENVKFMVVTANYNDLDILHHLIYMMDSNKSRVRKNILDFDGFGFNEDSEKYKKRMHFLNSLGYDISKRIAFLLGLSPFHTNIVQQDLNELIMYFLMSPTKIQHVPLRQFPESYLTEGPKNLDTFKNQDKVQTIPITSPPRLQTKISKKKVSSPTTSKKETIKKPPLKRELPSILQKAKKSFNPNKLNAPLVKQVLLPSPTSLLKTTQNNPIQSNATPQFTGISPTAVQLCSTSLSPPQILVQNTPNSQATPTSFSMIPKLMISQQPVSSQLRPTYKVIKLPATSPTTSLVSTKPSPLQIQMPPPVLSLTNTNQGTLLPPGIIVFKDKPLHISQPVQNISCLKAIQPQTKIILPANAQQALLAPNKPKEEFVLPDKVEGQSPDVWKNSEVEILHPLEESFPSDSELYQCIQDVIHSVNYEVDTLKNVLEKVAEKYSSFDLKPKHGFMKECIKKILLGE